MSDKMQIIIDVESGKATTKIKSLKDELGGVEPKADGAAKATNNLSDSFSNVAMEAAKGVAALAAIGSVISSSIDSVNEYQSAMTGLASIARYSGENIDSTLTAALELSKDGLMTNAESALALKNLLMRGFGLQEATEMINRFKDSAAFGRQASLGFGEAIVGATEGLKNENSMLVDNAGVTKNVSVMWKEYAQQLGVGEKSLTMAQKRQAEYNGIMRETEGQIGNADLASQGLIGAQAKLAQKTKDVSRAIGEALSPALTSMSNIGGDALSGFVKPMIFAFEKLGADIGYGATVMGVFYDSITNLDFSDTESRLNNLKKVHEEMLTQLAQEVDVGKSPVIGADSGARRKDVNFGSSAKDEAAQAKIMKDNELEAKRTEIAINAAQERFNALSLIAQTAGDDEETKAIDAFQQKMDRMEIEKEFLIQHGADRVELERQFDENRVLLAADLENQITQIRKIEADKQAKIEADKQAKIASLQSAGWSTLAGIAALGGKKYQKMVLEADLLMATSKAISGSVAAWTSGMELGGLPVAIASEAAHWGHVVGIMGQLKGMGASGATASAPTSSPATISSQPSYGSTSTNNQTQSTMNISLKVEGITGNEPPAVLQQLADMMTPAIVDQIAAGGQNVAVV